MNVTISAVIPVYNGSAFLEDAVESVLKQTRPVNEIVIINDGSSDNTAHIAKKLQQSSFIPIVIRNQTNVGVAAARNIGLSLSSSELVAFIDVDDLWHANKIADQLLSYEQDKDYKALSFSDYYIDEHSENARRFYQSTQIHTLISAPYSKEEFQVAFIAENFVSTASILIFNRMLALSIGGFNAALNISEDFDFILRYAKHAPILIVNKPLVTKRHHGENLTRNLLLYYWSHLYVLKQHLTQHPEYTRSDNSAELISSMKVSYDEFLIGYCNVLYERIRAKSFPVYISSFFRAYSLKGRILIVIALFAKVLRWVSADTIKRNRS